uniref:Uncharacterized protein n=1 Tax=Acrobeloides nanus TaxID=290746 RepID=A0A914D653_9BILA
MSKNVRKLPIMLVPYVKLIQEENCFETQKFEAVEKHQIGSKNKESKFKLNTLPNAQNYTIKHFKIANDSFESNSKKDKLKKNIAANQKQTLSIGNGTPDPMESLTQDPWGPEVRVPGLIFGLWLRSRAFAPK